MSAAEILTAVALAGAGGIALYIFALCVATGALRWPRRGRDRRP